jgi:uncharacterized protein (DUF4415 family)
MPPTTSRPTASRPPSGRIAYTQLGQTLRGLEEDLRWGLAGSARIPVDWHRIAQEQGPPPKTPVTLRLDEDVLRFFRSMGKGHLARMNAVLRAFMLARLAEVVKGYGIFEPTVEDQVAQLKAELSVLVNAQIAAREAAETELTEAEKRKSKLETFRMMRDARRG